MIRNIIFDLGGVILNIDYKLTIDKFKDFGASNIETIFSQAQQNFIFDKIDKGLISPEEFRQEIKSFYPGMFTDQTIDQAWNAMLINFPVHRIELLKELKKNYNTYLLSNTNAIHYPVYTDMLKKNTGVEHLNQIFTKLYLSHEIGMRKPDEEIFLYVLKDNNILANETLFIDDSEQHLITSKKLGINSVFLQPNADVAQLFENNMLRKDINELLY